MDYEVLELLKIIRQRFRHIAGTTCFITIVVGLVSFYFLPTRYEATTTMLVQPQISGNQVNFESLSANEKLVATYSEIIKSQNVAREVIVRLDLTLTEKELLKAVKAEGINDSLVTAITVRSGDPKQAALIANTFATSFKNKLPKLMKVENVAILDLAKSNPEPVSPKPLIYSIVAFVVSINVMTGVSLAKALNDKTVNSEAEVLKLTGVPVLVTVPTIKVKKQSRGGF